MKRLNLDQNGFAHYVALIGGLTVTAIVGVFIAVYRSNNNAKSTSVSPASSSESKKQSSVTENKSSTPESLDTAPTGSTTTKSSTTKTTTSTSPKTSTSTSTSAKPVQTTLSVLTDLISGLKGGATVRLQPAQLVSPDLLARHKLDQSYLLLTAQSTLPTNREAPQTLLRAQQTLQAQWRLPLLLAVLQQFKLI